VDDWLALLSPIALVVQIRRGRLSVKEGRNKKGHMSANVISLFDMVDVCVRGIGGSSNGENLSLSFPSRDSSSTLFHGRCAKTDILVPGTNVPTPNSQWSLLFSPLPPQPLIIRVPLHRD